MTRDGKKLSCFKYIFVLLQTEKFKSYSIWHLVLSIKSTLHYLEFLEIRSLHTDDVSKQLIFKTVSGDGEVDESTLSLHLRLVVRVGKLCMQDQSESWVVFTFLVTDLDVPVIF